MPRLTARTKTDASADARPLLEAVSKKFGSVPNLLATMANSATTLEAYLAFSSALAKSSLSDKLREQVALAVAELNRCGYCLAAHTTLGRMAGLSDEEMADSRRGSSPDRTTDAALVFARKVVSERGFVSDDDLKAVRAAGFDDAGVADLVATVAFNTFTNYFDHVAQTEVDFPEAEGLSAKPACSCG